MLRRTAGRWLKARPPTARTAVGSNRELEQPWFDKSQEFFAAPDWPNKLVIHNWRYFIYPGKCATGPPIGQDFASVGLKAMDFAKAFNDRTKGHFKEDVPLRCHVQVYYDKTYAWRLSPPPTAWYIMRAVRKKRRETGTLNDRKRYTAYMTLEMCYEIAKCTGIWTDDNRRGTKWWPSIELRAKKIALQAQLMGICIIGVEAPDSPIKGVTQAQYEAQAAEYRKQQRVQWEEYLQKELEDPATHLYERLHHPNLLNTSRDFLNKAVQRPNLLNDLWYASAPSSQAMIANSEQKRLQSLMSSMKAFRHDLTEDEMKALFFNWRLPSVERVRQLKGVDRPEMPDWTSDRRDIRP